MFQSKREKEAQMQQTVSLLQVRRVAETTLPTRCPRVVFENRVARSNRREEGDRGSSRRTAREVPRPVSARAAHSSGRAPAAGAATRGTPRAARLPRGSSRRCHFSQARVRRSIAFAFSRGARKTLTLTRNRLNRLVRNDVFDVSRTNSARRRRRSASCRAPSIRCTWRTATCARGWMPPPPGRS